MQVYTIDLTQYPEEKMAQVIGSICHFNGFMYLNEKEAFFGTIEERDHVLEALKGYK